MLVHGESGEMMRLKEFLTAEFAEWKLAVEAPVNMQAVQFSFVVEKHAKICGLLAAQVCGPRRLPAVTVAGGRRRCLYSGCSGRR